MISLSQLKMAQRNLIRMVGGQDAAGETIGAVTGHAVNQRRISEVLKDDIARSLRVHEVLILEAAAKQDQSGRQGGFPPVTRMLAATLGYALVKIPEAPAGASDWLGGMGALARQAGDLTGEIAKALADDVIDEREREVLCVKIREAQESLAALAVLAGAR